MPESESPDRVIVTCTSIGERADSLRNVVEALAPQCTELWLYLNFYDEEPDFVAEHPNVNAVTKGPNYGDAGKFVFDVRGFDFHLTVDDDIHYPPDYVARTLLAIEKYDREAVISWHGRRFDGRGPFPSYYHGATARYRLLGTVDEDAAIHVPGTVAMGYHTSLIRFPMEAFPIAQMTDIWTGVHCQKHRVGIICPAHVEGWALHQPIDLERTIWAQNHTRGEVQTTIINQAAPWMDFIRAKR